METKPFNNICAVPALKAYFGKGFSDSSWYPLSEITFLLLFNFSTAWEKLLSKVLESSVTQTTASSKNLGAIKEPKQQPWKFKSCMQGAKLSLDCAPSEVQSCCSSGISGDSWTCYIQRSLVLKVSAAADQPQGQVWTLRTVRTYINSLSISNAPWGGFFKRFLLISALPKPACGPKLLLVRNQLWGACPQI